MHLSPELHNGVPLLLPLETLQRSCLLLLLIQHLPLIVGRGGLAYTRKAISHSSAYGSASTARQGQTQDYNSQKCTHSALLPNGYLRIIQINTPNMESGCSVLGGWI